MITLQRCVAHRAPGIFVLMTYFNFLGPNGGLVDGRRIRHQIPR